MRKNISLHAETTVLCGFEICLIHKGEINHNKQQLDRFFSTYKIYYCGRLTQKCFKKKEAKIFAVLI